MVNMVFLAAVQEFFQVTWDLDHDFCQVWEMNGRNQHMCCLTVSVKILRKKISGW